MLPPCYRFGFGPLKYRAYVHSTDVLLCFFDLGLQADDIFVHFFRPARDGVNVSANMLVGHGTDAASLQAMGNTAFATRAAAGLGAYPTLPPPRLMFDQCADALQRICGGAPSLQQCALCCGQHQHDLRLAGCTAAQCSSFCATLQ